MKHFILFFSALLFFGNVAYAQKVTISGFVKDADNGETISGVYILLTDTATKTNTEGSISNNAGFYSITVDKSVYHLTLQSIGYNTVNQIITLQKTQTLNFELVRNVIITDEVVVTGKREDRNVSAVDVGKMEMKIEAIKALPAFMGEVDVLKSLQLLPGIQSGAEGNSGFYVRGGNSDQNLILLDGVPIYNAGHLFGFFSIFNANAVKNVEVYKSGMPANYGNRLASIIDVTQNDGNMKQFQLEGNIGLIFSSLTVQGPIKKDKCSFIISARRTYIDWLIQPFLKPTSMLKGVKFYFYDLNAKINWIINDKHRIFLSGYYGNDKYGFRSNSGAMKAVFQWGNAAASLRWQYLITPKLFLNTTATFSNYDLNTDMGIDTYSAVINSGIRDYGFKSELTFIPNPKHNMKMGIDYTFHTFFPSNYNISTGSTSDNFTLQDVKPYYAHELAIYVNDEYEVTRRLKINMGLRYTHFEHVGSFTRYILDDFGYIEDSVTYKPGEIIQQYNFVEPRLGLRFLIDSNTSIKASYTLNRQYLHQISMASISLPTDVWMPSTSYLKPQIGHQVSLGIYRNFYHNMFESYIDGYYKNMRNITEYREDLDFSSFNINPDQMYTFGKGYSWGIEFFLKKNKGRFTGFIGYTLAFSRRQFDDLNNGEWFDAKYDRRHDISINLNYEIVRNKLSVSAVWVFATGNTMTIPVGYYFFNGSLMTEYSSRNAYRIAPYHRLDLSINWQIAKRKHFETGLNLSVYNLYSRKNPFFIFYETETNIDLNMTDPTFMLNTTAYQMSLFPIIPTLTWNFKIK